MKKTFLNIFMFIILLALILAVNSCVEKAPEGFILVKGGAFKNAHSSFYRKSTTIDDFYIGIYEITQKEWTEIMGTNPSEKKGDNLPVETVSWYDVIEYCNQRSIKEGLLPVYNIDRNTKDPVNTNELDQKKWNVSVIDGANGYRLPSEAEWDYAAGGGQKSKDYTYSGSNDLNKVGWYWRNAGDEELSGQWHWAKIENNNNSIKEVGSLKANELGLYDMSGNVREWCWDWYEDYNTNSGLNRVWKGGGYIGGEGSCETAYSSGFGPDNKSYDQGFRICRNRIK